MKTVLMVAYHYPPDSAVGALRTRRFVRYLPEFGWAPVVLTVRRKGDAGDGMPIIGTRILPGLRDAARFASSILPGRAGDVQAGATAECAAGYLPPDPESVPRLRRALYALMWLPDDRQGWFAPAVAAGVLGVVRHQAQVVYSSAPPWTGHLVGLAVATLTRRPLVADFRDPWVGNPWKPAFVRTRWSDRADAAMERMVVERSAAVLCNTASVERQMKDRYRGVPDDRFKVLPNGFDPEDVRRSCRQAHAARNGVVFAYAGTMYGARDPRPLFRAASAVRAKGVRSFRMVFMGDCARAKGIPLTQMVKEHGLEDCVELAGNLPRQQCIERLREADVLLLFDMGRPCQVAAKLFEYIGLGKPVLALAEPGSETAKHVVEAKAGVVADARDEEAVSAAFELAVGGELCGSPPDVRARYDGRMLTGTLAKVLDAVSRARDGRNA